MRRPGTLYKQHRRECPNSGAKIEELHGCDCAWSASYKGKERALAKWLGRAVAPRSRKAAYTALGEFTAAIDGPGLDRFVPTATTSAESGTLAGLVDEYVTHHINKKLAEKPWNCGKSADEIAKIKTSTKDMLGVVRRGSIAKLPLEELVRKPKLIEDWLNTTGARRKPVWRPATWNKYHGVLYALFEKATVWTNASGEPRVPRNPVKAIDLKPVYRPKKRRIFVEEVEQRLFAACDELDKFDEARRITKATLTAEQVAEIRARVESGETQKAVAEAFKVSATTVCQIVNGKTWNPKLQRQFTRGSEMRRRLIAAFDGGPRLSELLQTQIKHVDWTPVRVDDVVGYRIILPPEITKGGKSSMEDEVIYALTPRFKQMLDERRLQLRRKNKKTEKWEPNPDGFIFGTESGASQLSMDKTMPRLFRLAGLEWGRYKARWHGIRGEFVSRVGEDTKNPMLTKEMARHQEYETTEGYMSQREEEMMRAAAGLARRNRG